MPRDSIFISYSHKDIKWFKEVKKHLSFLEISHSLVVWDDTKIKTGSNWRNDIQQSINRCRIAILLVSSNFLASEFILRQELPGILKAARHEGLVIFNIILETCAFHLTELEIFQCLNNPQYPLEELKPAERNRVLVQLATELLAVTKKIKSNSQQDNQSLDNATIDLGSILVLACLAKTAPMPITAIEQLSALNRKTVVTALENLQQQGHIEKYHGQYNKKPSTMWKVSVSGLNIITQFEKAYEMVMAPGRLKA